MPPKKRIIRVNSTDDDVHLVVKEKGLGKDNKSLHSGRKEAWSADMADSRTRPTHWQFNKRGVHIKDKIMMQSDSDHLNGRAEVSSAIGGYKSKHYDETRSLNLHDGPNIIYSRDLQNRHYKHSDRDIYVEDYDGDYTTPKSHIRKRMQADDDLETESIRRHEMERGSDRVYRRTDFGETGSFRRSFRRQHAAQNDDTDGMNEGRDQLFIREGNTEILRLITRGRQEEDQNVSQQQRPVTLVQQPQYILVDSGKHLLMERFIEQQLLQQQELQNAPKQHSNTPSVILPNETMHSKSELNHLGATIRSKHGSEISSSSLSESKRTAYFNHELLETSLRQQNELLRQILLEKERLDQRQSELSTQREEMKLETQSLPGHSVIAMATQTDCTTSTQTDPQYLRPPKRQIRSDNDDSLSEDEDDFHLYIIKQSDDADGIRWIKKRKKYKRRKAREGDRRVVASVRRHIRTPILEESESPLEHEKQSKKHESSDEKKNYHETRTSVMRRKKNEEAVREQEKRQIEKSLEKSDTSEPSRKTSPSKNESSGPSRRTSPLKKDILLEITESLENSEQKIIIKSPRTDKKQKIEIELYDSDSEDEKVYAAKAGKLAEFLSEDSLEYDLEIQKPKDKRNAVFSRQGSSTEARESSDHDRLRVKSEEVLYSPREESKSDGSEKRKFRSTTNLLDPEDLVSTSKSSSPQRNNSNPKKNSDKKKVDVTKSTPRYMQWYNKNNAPAKPVAKKKEEEPPKKVKKTNKAPKSVLADTKSSSIKKVYPVEKKTDEIKTETSKKPEKQTRNTNKIKESQNTTNKSDKSQDEKPSADPSTFHPLVQHSEYRFEHPYSQVNGLTNGQPQYSATAPVGVPAPVTTSIQTSMLPPQPHQISVQPSDVPPHPTKKTPEKPPRPNLKKEASIGKLGHQPILKAPGIEEDYDSGIAMTSLVHDVMKRNQITEKKSIFTIAYDDIHTKQLRPDSTTPPY